MKVLIGLAALLIIVAIVVLVVSLIKGFVRDETDVRRGPKHWTPRVRTDGDFTIIELEKAGEDTITFGSYHGFMDPAEFDDKLIDARLRCESMERMLAP